MNVRLPYGFDGRGRTADAGEDAYVRGLIETVLFTSPGERVNHPDFGSGVLQLVFAPSGPELAATTQMLVQGALQQWLGDVISVESVVARADEGVLRLDIVYTIRRTGVRLAQTFTSGTAP
jgi:phage baseplate assembly protein W